MRLTPVARRLQRFVLYESKTRFYLIASSNAKTEYRLLKINRSAPGEDISVVDDGVGYSRAQILQMLEMLKEAHRSSGGLSKVTMAFGVVGFVRIFDEVHLLLITQRVPIGSIGRHAVYRIGATQMISCQAAAAEGGSLVKRIQRKTDESRYRALFSGFDLTKDFYFSYTYDLSRTLQYNMSCPESARCPDDMFVWNSYLTQTVEGTSDEWTVSLVHGYFRQTKISVFGRIVNMTVIARRSRYFAGTRFLKRGVTETGQVANHVETEQIVDDFSTAFPSSGQFTSYVQVRGSIPLFWTQENSVMTPKPPIEVQRIDPYYVATRLHFESLIERYGHPIIIFNLVKSQEKSPRESLLRKQYAAAVEHLNVTLPEKHKLRYIAWDISRASKGKSDNLHLIDCDWDLGGTSRTVLGMLSELATRSVNETGFFHSGRKPGGTAYQQNAFEFPGRNPYAVNETGCFQNGIVRVNCVDSLDRTNVSLFCVGHQALGHQLYALGLTETTAIHLDSEVVSVFMDMFEEMGDHVALQYGGSPALHAVETYRNVRWGFDSKDLVTNMRRFYSNNFTDAERQQSMNLFLGNYVPAPDKPRLWEMESDQSLHQSETDETIHSGDWVGAALRRRQSLPSRRYRLSGADDGDGDGDRSTADDGAGDGDGAESKATLEEYYDPSIMTFFDQLAADQHLQPVEILDLSHSTLREADWLLKKKNVADGDGRYKSYRGLKQLLQWAASVRQKQTPPRPPPKKSVRIKPPDSFITLNRSAYEAYGINLHQNRSDIQIYEQYLEPALEKMTTVDDNSVAFYSEYARMSELVHTQPVSARNTSIYSQSVAHSGGHSMEAIHHDFYQAYLAMEWLGEKSDLFRNHPVHGGGGGN